MKRGMLTAMLMMSTLGVNGSTYPFKTGSGMNPNYRRPEKKKQEKEFCIKGIKVMAYSQDLIFLNLKKKQRIEWNQVKSQIVYITKQ